MEQPKMKIKKPRKTVFKKNLTDAEKKAAKAAREKYMNREDGNDQY